MATPLENLKTARANLAAKIAEVSTNRKPTYSVDGQSVSHGDYLAGLIKDFDALTATIAKLEPFCLVSQVI